MPDRNIEYQNRVASTFPLEGQEWIKQRVNICKPSLVSDVDIFSTLFLSSIFFYVQKRNYYVLQTQKILCKVIRPSRRNIVLKARIYFSFIFPVQMLLLSVMSINVWMLTSLIFITTISTTSTNLPLSSLFDSF